VSGGASDEDTTVVTDFGYDAYGRLTSTTRANRDPAGTLLDSRIDALTYDDTGNLTSEIANYVDGVVTPGTIDTEPAAGGARTDLTTSYTYDTAGNRVSTADPRRAIGGSSTTTAHDDFGRTVADGWGTADTGGSWSGTTADHDVGSGVGTVALTSATNRNAYLTSVSIRDQEALVRVKVDRLAVGGDLFSWLFLRRQDSSNYYQARLTFTTTAKTVVSLVETAGGSSTVLAAATTSLPHTTSDWYWLRASVTGTTATTFKARLWKDGTTEPGAWTIETTDTSVPAALQNAGHIGIRMQADGGYSGSFPIVASYDGLHLTSPGGGGSLGPDDYVSRSTFDPLNQAITSSTPTTPGLAGAAETATTTYDELGALRSSSDIADLVTATAFDRAGRALTTYEDPDPAGSAYTTGQMTVDADGKTLTSMDRRQAAAAPGYALGWTAFGYDGLGRQMSCTWAAGINVGDCLPVGTAGWTNPPTRSTTTRWDARNGRIGLTDSESNRTTVYDPDHGYAVSAIYLPTHVDQTKEHQSLYGYDAKHRLTSITHQLCTISTGHACSSTTATGSVTYEYDDSDNRKRVVENNGSASTDYRYCHDARNQLTGRGSTASCDTSSVESFTYDDAGNRTQAVEAGTTRNFAYTTAGLLCDQETGSAASCSGGNVTSDDAGRISDQSGWHYLNDAQARLVSACEDADCVGTGFDRLDFEYDGEGHRTTITETPASGSAVVWTFRYQGDAIVAEYKDGTLYREYVTDDQGTISKVIVPAGQTGTGTYLVTWNGHGDAMALHRIESTGLLTLANSYTYGTWGRPTTATHNSIADLGFRFLYVGAADVQWDSTYGVDLLYMHARHYSPSLGRFLHPDPSRLDAQLFVYTANGPVSKVDPRGEHPCLITFALGPIVGTVSCGVATVAVVATAVAAWWTAYSIQVRRVTFPYPYATPGTAAYRWICYGGLGCAYLSSTASAYDIRRAVEYAFASRNQMERERLRGLAPRGIEGVHAPHGNAPGAQEHVHVNGGALNKNGTIHDGKRPRPLTNAQREWLRRHGWGTVANWR
jgi:RHS repeat-associated protein